MGKTEKLQNEKEALESQLKELNFKFYNEEQNGFGYIIPREIFILKRQIRIKEIDIEHLNK